MQRLYIDIETIPCQQEGFKESLAENIKPPGNISKQETIDKWYAEKQPLAVEEEYLKSSFNGTHGEIVVIGYAFDDEDPQAFYRNLGGSEQNIIRSFFDTVANKSNGVFQIVGHNVRDFDLRFLFHRAVINGEYPTFDLCQDRRYNDDRVYDTMRAWAGWNGFISLDKLCNVLDIESPKGDCDGSKVWEFVQDNRCNEVAEYCKADVAATREVFKRLTFNSRF